MSIDTTDIVIPSKADAEAVQDALLKLLDRYEVVTLADYLDLVGLSSTFSDARIGWTELNDILIQPLKGGFVLFLPEPKII